MKMKEAMTFSAAFSTLQRIAHMRIA